MQTNPDYDSSPIPTKAAPVRDSLPPVWNIREQRDRDFVGHEAPLEEIREDLCEHGIAILNEDIPPVGGVGKSHLAREYAYRHANEYQVVWWVQAEESGVLQFGYAQLLSALNLLAGLPDEPQHSVEAARDYLSAHSGWLLILDGLETAESLKDLLPAPGAGHVIVTTLLGAASFPHKCLPVSRLTREESLRFLQTRLPGIDAEQVHAITDQLDRSPLIIDLFSKYVNGSGVAVRDALKTLRSKTPIPLQSNVTKEVYKGVLRILVTMILEDLKKGRAAARDLAILCSFLGPHDIPTFLLNQETDGLSKRLSEAVRDEAAFDECLNALAAYGLIERHESSISMHEIVQEAIREQLPEPALQAWASAAVRLVAGVFPFKQRYRSPIPECNRLLAHGLAATQYAEEVDVAMESSAQLLYHIGLYLHGRDALRQAKTC